FILIHFSLSYPHTIKSVTFNCFTFSKELLNNDGVFHSTWDLMWYIPLFLLLGFFYYIVTTLGGYCRGENFSHSSSGEINPYEKRSYRKHTKNIQKMCAIRKLYR